MAKGNEAKANLIKRFATAVGADYCGEVDKKYYFWSTENGERVQIAISMTCPKTPVEFANSPKELDWSDDASAAPAEKPQKYKEMDQTEKETLERLMKELDL